jgi:hypothetical protein
MSEFFILQNQAKLFLGKQKDWLDGRDPGSLFKTPHKDEAINQMVEISSKDYTQRIKVISCEVNEKGVPILAEELLPPPLPKIAKSPNRDLLEEVAEDDLEPDDEIEETLEFTAEPELEDTQTNLL